MLSTSEETLENIFNQAAGYCGAVERVKKIKDYAFIHFHDRDDALRALNIINGMLLFCTSDGKNRFELICQAESCK